MPMLIQKHTLTLEAAKNIIALALQKAKELGVGGAIAIVDDGGHLICLERIDGSMPAAANIAIGKAATAIGFQRPGAILEQTITTDRPVMQTLNSVTSFPYVPLKGSYPIFVNKYQKYLSLNKTVLNDFLSTSGISLLQCRKDKSKLITTIIKFINTTIFQYVELVFK